MKIFKRKLIKGTNWALAGLMSLLGFNCSGCGSVGPATEYGSPHAEYKVMGIVKNEKGEVLNGIRITVPEILMNDANGNEDLKLINDTVYTDEQGKFLYGQTQYFPLDNVQMKLEVDDPTGAFEAISDSVQFNRSKLSGGKGWFYGTAFKVKDFILKQKK